MKLANSVTYELHPLQEVTGCFIGRFNIGSLGPFELGSILGRPFTHIVRFVEALIV